METTATQRVQPQTTPSWRRGEFILTGFIFGMELMFLKKAKEQKEIFNQMFNPDDIVIRFGKRYDGKHLKDLFGKFSLENFNGFFLNLDRTLQRVWMAGITHNTPLDLSLPVLPDWRELGRKMFVNPQEVECPETTAYTEYMVRKFAPAMNIKSEWDVWPHDLIWVSRALLYFNNNSIDDPQYTGKRYGNFENWMAWYKYASLIKRSEFLINLITYA